MNIEPDNQQNQSISDDQELAKVLAGVNQAADDTPAADPAASDDASMPMPSTPMPDAPAADELPAPQTESPTEDMPAPSTPMPEAPAPDLSAASGSSDLDSIKQQALGELRPLVDKLDVSAEEKFDTYLLLLRSTDDKELIAPAHAAAKNIADEARRAQALLDIIKEIDFLSKPQ